MTRPPDPGQPYGPPHPRPGGGGGGLHPQPPPAPRPVGPGQPPPLDADRDFGEPVSPRQGGGFIGALFDVNFNNLITPKLIKHFYVLLLIAITLWNLGQFVLGMNIAGWDDAWAWGVMIMIATPVTWLIEIILWRLILEAIIVRFKGVEYLRIMKDKDGTR
ncbi:MAG TPA: DUF4282 domain-containing protein [Streptosporangiaceae bacterium]|nr:DUF4282 domain-containing protein [Streptosporangiaceae bacterium]